MDIYLNGNEIEFCIKNAILPFGQIIEFYTHEDDLCDECICDPSNTINIAYMINKKQSYYINKNKFIIDKILEKNHDSKFELNNKMKSFLIKDIQSILKKYNDYNFDLTDLHKSLENL